MDDFDMYEEQDDDGDDEFYIPPPRPDIDLGHDPDLLNYERAASPSSNYTSMSSEDGEEKRRDSLTKIDLERKDSFSSCYSIDSEDCEKIKPKVTMKENPVGSSSVNPDLIPNSSDLRHECLTLEFTYKAICDALRQLTDIDVEKFCRTLWKDYPRLFHIALEETEMVSMVDNLLDGYGLVDSMLITTHILEEMGRKRAAEKLLNVCLRNEVRHDLCESLRRTYGREDTQSFSDVYTELHITSKSNNGPNIEHEVLKIEKMNSNHSEGHALSPGDIFSQEAVQQDSARLVFLTGVAGVGKSSVVRKLILDWADRRSHQHVSFLFPLPFRELVRFEGVEVSLMDILHDLYPETRRLKEADYRNQDCTMMFICDGLDEYVGELDFTDTELLSHHKERASLNVLVVNLLRGRLLYRGLYLITTRPQVRSYIPWEAHHQVMEVRGFLAPARADFFRKRFEDQAGSVLSFLDSNPTLGAMCHLPLFCSLLAEECQRSFRDRLPVSLCHIYTRLLLSLTHQRRPPEVFLEFLMGLGRLAFHLLEQGQFMINKSDWSGFGVDDREAVTHSGLCTEYLIKSFVLYEEKVISFIHPTVQEHLAALYAFLSFKMEGRNVLESNQSLFRKSIKKSLFHSALDRSLCCDDGRLDIFLRFLSGMHLKANTDLFSSFCVTTPTSTDEATALLRDRIEKNQHPERTHNLRCCLLELQQT